MLVGSSPETSFTNRIRIGCNIRQLLELVNNLLAAKHRLT